MSRRLYRPPFHRQILPWLFAAVFFALAPVLIFYTSGYRINTKKSVIDRTGTVIVDSTPRGARVILDGKEVSGTTAVTLQEIAPGPHTLEVLRDGYFPWKKKLDVKAEQVTFANTIWLVKVSDPELRFRFPVERLSADTGRNQLAMFGTEATGTKTLTLWSASNDTQTAVSVSSTEDFTSADIRFAPNGRSFLLGGSNLQEGATWFSIDGTQLRPEALPSGRYFWDGTRLVGSNETQQITWDTGTETLAETRVTSTVIETLSPLSLVIPTSTNTLAIKYDRQPNTLYELSNPTWRFAGRQDGYTLLRKDGAWLAVSTNDASQSKIALGSDLVWFEGDAKRGLLVNSNEVSTWDLDTDSEVIWRRSDPVVAVDWHRSGEIVFLATEHEVLAMELDPRDGRLIYQLGNFDRVYDLAVLNKELFVAAEKNGERGVFVFKTE